MDQLSVYALKLYSVDVCRIGYGARTIEVEATSQAEANEKALSIAGDFEFSEHASDYVLADGETPGQVRNREQMENLAKSVRALSEQLRAKRDLTNVDRVVLEFAHINLVDAGFEK